MLNRQGYYNYFFVIEALARVERMMISDGRAFVCASATTSMSMSNTPHQQALRELLIRHRRALSGKEFYGSLDDGEII